MELEGEEVIHSDEWAELSESERGKWETVDEHSDLLPAQARTW
jgi:hypothetical protein